MRFALPSVFALALLATISGFVTPGPPPISIDTVRVQLQDRAVRLVNQFDQVCEDLHLHSMDLAVTPMKFEADPDVYGSQHIPTFKLDDRHAYGFTYLQSDESLRNFGYQKLFRDLFDFPAPSFDKPIVPEWSKDEAIKVGDAFLKVFSDVIKVKLGKPSARYDQAFQNNKYHVGKWMIQWPRINDKGVGFSDDYVIMQIPEGYGPESVQINLTTSYTENSGDPMSHEQALKIVQRKIASDEYWDKIESLVPWHQSDGWTDPKPTNTYMQIVRPFHEENVPARLAWVFWFKQHYPPPDRFHYPICSWIDAYTGSYIGGDSVGLDSSD